MSYVNLHSHSHYSLLDGFGSPKAIVQRAKELGYPAASLTDHGVTYGLVEFYQAAKASGIKPLLGCELYVARRTRFDKEAKIDVKPYHLTILAKNNVGYRNLLSLVSKAQLEGFYYKPRVDYGLLKSHSEGLIALSGCQASHLSQSILSENDEEIQKVIDTHLDIFGKENYFLEVQDHPLLENQEIINKKVFELSKEHGLDVVATNDTHYPRPEDSEVHDIMLCIQTGSIVSDADRMKYTGDFSMQSIEDVQKAFPDNPEVISNTLKIADMCNVELTFGENLIPQFDTPNCKDADVYLRELCEDGLSVRFDGKKPAKEYMERLDYELKMVHEMGFDTYFLIVWDFVKFAKDNNIVVGPGRGSAAGSIIAWTLGITELDPIHYGLFFERFLNPERVSMPDIDIDFADNRRDEVLDYVVNKYGRDKVAQIVTFGTMAPRAAVRDVGRALGYPYAEVDALAKIIPPPVLGQQVPLVKSIKKDPELSNEYKKNSRAKVLLDYAKKIEGTVRHVGTHACAVVISEQPLTDYTALQYGASGDGEIVTQFSAKPLESLGLLKMDFLGLRNLTVIDHTIKILKRTQPKVEVDMSSLPLDNEKTFELLKRADTTGVFQLESGGMRRYLKQLKPNKFEDIVAMGALYRPGPMEWIPTYIEGKHNPEKVKYLDDSFKEILESTYGVAVYQEQILQLARDFAGFSLGEADILRKAVGKKIASLLEEQREKFISGAVKNGHDRKFAAEVFEKVIEPFAGYGFNKAHAACYGMIAYQTAYLKAHFPVEFMTALLCSDSGNMDRVVLEIKECTEMGVEVLPPSINESFADFTVVDEKSIRFGLMAIKGVGEGPVKEIISVRNDGGQFKSLEDFAARVPSKLVNKKLVQALAASGAFDEFDDRNQIFENYEEISKFAKNAQAAAQGDQSSIFGLMDEEADHGGLVLQDVPESTSMQRLKWEKAFLGLYVSGHPMKGLKRYISRKASLISSFSKNKLGKIVKCVGIVTDFRRIMTKAGGYMVTFVLEDPTARVSVIMFPKTYAKYGTMVAEDQLISLSGRFDNRRGPYQIICDAVKNLSFDILIENAKEAKVFDSDEKKSVAVRLIDDILAETEEEVDDVFVIEVAKDIDQKLMEKLKSLLVKHKGGTPVELRLNGHGKKLKLPFGVELTDELKKMVSSIVG